MTDLKSRIVEIVGIAPTPHEIVLCEGNARHELLVEPNHVYRLADEKWAKHHAVSFDYPHR